MISNSAKLDRRTKQHTQFGVSESHGSRDMVRTKSWRKKKKEKKKTERGQNHIASPTGIANNNNNNNETGSRSSCIATEERSPKMKNSTQTTLPHFNFSVTAKLNDVTSRLIILINEEINEANCMVRNSAKLDRRTKQHTQFGVSTSDGSRDMAWTKSWAEKRKKEKKKNERGQNHIAIPYWDR